MGILVAGLAGLILVGCSVQPPMYSPPPSTDPPETRVVVDTTLDGAWNRLRRRAPEQGFSVMKTDPAMRRMELAFSADPADFVDCGSIRTDGRAGYDGAYIAWRDRESGYIDLGGEMVVTLNTITPKPDPNKTTVEYSARYWVVLRRVRHTRGAPQLPPGSIDTVEWTFETAGADTQEVANKAYGITEDRTCRPTHDAERRIFDILRREDP